MSKQKFKQGGIVSPKFNPEVKVAMGVPIIANGNPKERVVTKEEQEELLNQLSEVHMTARVGIDCGEMQRVMAGGMLPTERSRHEEVKKC